MNGMLRTGLFRKAAASAVLVLLSALCAAQSSDSERISQLLRQTKTHAVAAANNAAQLETYSMAGVPWQVHYYRLQQIGDDVNALAKDQRQLNRLRDNATPEQQAIIDRLRILMDGLALSVNSARHYLVHNPSEVNMPTFHNQVRENFAQIQRVSAAVCQCASAGSNALLTAKAEPPAKPGATKTAGPDCPSTSSVDNR